MANLKAIVKQLEAERARIDAAIQALQGLGQRTRSNRKRRTLSTAARRKIAAAQRARWAKLRAGKK